MIPMVRAENFMMSADGLRYVCCLDFYRPLFYSRRKYLALGQCRRAGGLMKVVVANLSEWRKA